MPKSGKIGIVIVAFNRKDYIMEAIKSALNQKAEELTYIVTVVKNFLDDEIDKFINLNNINNIYTNNISLGYKILLGVIFTNAQIICFLEDDDLFIEDKIDIVYKKFKENKNLVYYHNSMIPIGDGNQILTKWYKQENRSLICDSRSKLKILRRLIRYGGHNMSSISVSRNIILRNTKMFVNSTHNLDYSILLLALSSCGLILSDSDRVTYYKMHSSAVHINDKNYEGFVSKVCILKENSINTLYNLHPCIIGKNIVVENIYQLMLNQYLISHSFFCDSSPSVSIIKYISLFKYQYSIKNYFMYLILLILFKWKGFMKIKRKLLEYYHKNYEILQKRGVI